MAPTRRIIFQPSGIRIELPEECSILEAAEACGEEIESVCGGNGSCGKCAVRVLKQDGKSSESSESCLSPVTEQELVHFSPEEIDHGMRLACEARIQSGEVTIFVPEASRRSRQVIRKGARELPVTLKPAVAWLPVSVTAPTLERPEADVSRLQEAIERVCGFDHLSIDRGCLQRLPDVLTKSKGQVKALIWQRREILDVKPSAEERLLGVAIDIGTTTVAGYLTDLATGEILATDSMMNPQVSRGEDVMSRLSHVRMKEDGLNDLNRLIIDGLNELTEKLCASAGVSHHQVVDMSVVGNTVMHHIFAGLDPRKLAVVPFPPVISSSQDIKAREIGLKVHPGAYVHLLPVEAGFVGADNVAVLIAEQPYLSDELSLIIDIGTNGEIVFGNRERLVSASCACGPAFEGAHIHHGMRAMPGAIEKVRIDPKTLKVSYQVIGADGWFSKSRRPPLKVRGLCGSGVVDAVAQMLDAGIVGTAGRMETGGMAGLSTGPRGEVEFVIAPASHSVTKEPITITAGDVRAIQNGKAAFRAGIDILLRRFGVSVPDRIILAGAFGMHLDVKSVLRIGMVPEIPMDRILGVGNAAGDGARLALLSEDKRREAEDIARKVHYIELSADPTFNDQYIMALAFP
jgi:uncharacterized 2Fe-2S/4Fe-4S cluster protein (DUF4445 family)